MSDNSNFQVGPLEEVTTDIEDCNNVKDFFYHFKIDMPDYLSNAIQDYENELKKSPAIIKEDYNKEKNLIEHQNNFRVALCRAMVESNHPLFKDELFKTVITNSDQVVFTSNFDKQISEALTVDNK